MVTITRMTSSYNPITSFFLLTYSLLFTLLLTTTTTSANMNRTTTFTLDLIHKHSIHFPSKPYYYPTRSSLQRSMDRTNNASSADDDPIIRILPGDGDYLMKVSIGTPPTHIYASMETRSDLIWTQCEPCVMCFQQQHNDPHFNPSNSSTYAPLPCDSPHCYPNLNTSTAAFSSLATTCSNGTCFYFQRQGWFLTDGVLGTENITLDDVVNLPHSTFGCGVFNAYYYYGGGDVVNLPDTNTIPTVRPSGSVGLGPGPTSLLAKVHEYSLTDHSFTYCLTPPFLNNGTTKLRFGRNDFSDGANVSDSHLTNTSTLVVPMSFLDPYSDYRFVLHGITVGGEMVQFSQVSSGGQGTELYMIMDTGTPLMFLPSAFYDAVASNVENQTKHLDKVDDPLAMLEPCYKVNGRRGDELADIDVPEIKVHFEVPGDGQSAPGALKLKPENTFIKTSEDVACLAIAPTMSDNTGVYGSLAQMNFLVTYDVDMAHLLFKEADCSKIN